MTDSLTIFGDDFTGVTGIKATGTGNGTLTYIRPRGTKSIGSNGTNIDVTEYAAVDVSVSSSPNLQAKTNISPTTSSQTIQADSGYDGLSSVQINAMPIADPFVSAEDYEFYTSGNDRMWRFKPYVEVDAQEGDTAGYIADGTHIQGEYVSRYAVPSNTTITPSTSAQTIGGADYMMEGAVTVAAMPSGSVSASATKGSVSNHAISVTPTATVGTAGYLAAGSTNGTAVSVTASELVSGNLAISENGSNIDVANYATVSVSVEGGGGSGMSIATTTKTLSSAASSIAFDNLSGEPTSFAITANANTPTGGTAVTEVIYDGANFYGSTLTSQVTGSTGFSKSYSNGTLTITATSATFSAIEYKLVYSYGGSSSNVGSDGNYVGSGATSITFNNVTEEPSYFACVFSGNFATSSGYQRVIGVVYDGTSTYGLAMDSAAKPQTSWSYSYSNGALTITSTGTNNGGYFHSDGTTEYKLVYGIADPSPYEKVSKTYRASTSDQSDTIQPSTGYDAIDQVSITIPAVTQTNLSAENIKSGTTISISNGQSNLWSVTGSYTGGGGSVTVKTTTMTNNSATATQIQFTQLTGQPKAFFCRCTSNLSRSSSNRYYYIADIRWDGSSTGGVAGNKYYVYNGQYSNQTTGYSQSYSSGTLTLTTTGSQTASPGSFFNGTYELVYVY